MIYSVIYLQVEDNLNRRTKYSLFIKKYIYLTRYNLITPFVRQFLNSTLMTYAFKFEFTSRNNITFSSHKHG